MPEVTSVGLSCGPEAPAQDAPIERSSWAGFVAGYQTSLKDNPQDMDYRKELLRSTCLDQIKKALADYNQDLGCKPISPSAGLMDALINGITRCADAEMRGGRRLKSSVVARWTQWVYRNWLLTDCLRHAQDLRDEVRAMSSALHRRLMAQRVKDPTWAERTEFYADMLWRDLKDGDHRRVKYLRNFCDDIIENQMQKAARMSGGESDNDPEITITCLLMDIVRTVDNWVMNDNQISHENLRRFAWQRDSDQSVQKFGDKKNSLDEERDSKTNAGEGFAMEHDFTFEAAKTVWENRVAQITPKPRYRLIFALRIAGLNYKEIAAQVSAAEVAEGRKAVKEDAVRKAYDKILKELIKRKEIKLPASTQAAPVTVRRNKHV